MDGSNQPHNRIKSIKKGVRLCVNREKKTTDRLDEEPSEGPPPLPPPLPPHAPLEASPLPETRTHPHSSAVEHRVIHHYFLQQPRVQHQSILPVLVCSSDCDWMPGLSSWLTGQHPIINLIGFACIYLHVNYCTHCTPDHRWKEGSPTKRFFSRFLPC